MEVTDYDPTSYATALRLNNTEVSRQHDEVENASSLALRDLEDEADNVHIFADVTLTSRYYSDHYESTGIN